MNLQALLGRLSAPGRSARRAVAVLAAAGSVAAGAVVLSAGPAAAAVPSCATAQIGVTALHGPVFYIDPGNAPALTSAYAGYQITNSTGTPLTDTWVALSGFTGGSVALGSGQPAAEQVATLASNASKSLFWYLTASGASSSAQNHVVTVYTHQPGLANSSVLCTTSGGFTSVATTIGANANKITAVALSSPTPTLGATFSITVTGDTGTIGSGLASDPQAFWMSPSAISGWPAGAYRLVGTHLTIPPAGSPGAQDYTDVLHLNNMAAAQGGYTATYTFQATGFTATNSTLLPAEQISSGTQMKHTGSYPSSIPAIAPATNDLAVTLGASPTHLPSSGGTVTYTAALAGTTGASLDSLNLTAPAGASVVPGSAKFDGTTLPDPVSDGSGGLVLQGPFTLTSGTDTLSVQLGYGAGSGKQRTSLVGKVGSTVIDTTPNDLTDDSPATVDISVNTPPVATADSTTVAAGSGPSTLAVLANDTDADSDTLTVTGVTAPDHGTAVPTGSGVQYTPVGGYVGPDSFTYTISDGNGGTSSATVSVDVSDSVLAQTIDFPQPPDATLLSTVNLTATSDSGLQVAFTSLSPDVCTVDTTSGGVTVVAAGTCTIEAAQDGDATHAAAEPVSRSFAVERAGQTITFGQPADVPLSSGAFALGATSDSGLPVDFSSTTPSTCTVTASGTVTPAAAGTCTVEADQPGDDTYTAAAPVSRSFTITAPVTTPQALTFTPIADTPLTAGQTTAAASADSGLAVSYSSSTPTTCSVDGTTGVITLLATGTCTIEADQAGDATYSAATPVSRSFAIVRAAQAITFPQPPDGRVGQTIALTAASDAGLPVSYTSNSPTVCVVDAAGTGVDLVGTGACDIDADQAGDAEYLPATATASLTVLPALLAQTITFPVVADTAVTATDVHAAATAGSGLPVVYNSLTPAVCDVAGDGTVTLHATGTCTLQADQPGDGTYAAAPSATASFTVGRADQSITFTQPAAVHVSDTGAAVVATATSGLPVTFTSSTPGVCGVDGTGALHLVAAGSCTITADQSGSATFAPAGPVSRSFQVNRLPQTITLSAPAVEDVSIGTVTVTATSDAGLPVTVTASPAGVCAMTGYRTLQLIGSGSCRLVATAGGDTTHDAAAPAQATVAVTAQADDKTYTLPPPTVSAGGSSGSTTVDVLAGDPSGQTLVSVTQPHDGHVTVVGQRVRITMPPGYKGTDSFSYTTRDAAGGLHTATVTIIVPNSPPTVRVADTSTVAGTGRSLVVHLADANHDPLSIVVGPHPGARVRVVDGQLRVVPAVTYSGRLRFPVTVSDGDGGTAHATVAVLVRPRSTPVATRRLVTAGTRIAWRGVPTTGARYLVTVDGRRACVTVARACTVAVPFGPRAHVTVTVLGSDRTVSGARLARPKGGAAVLVGTVYFATSSAAVSPLQRQRVRALAHRLARDGFTRVRLVGYTDSRGSVAYNLDLSERRAFAVAAVLQRRARVAVHGGWRGESRPADSNATVHGRALNRRVEIWVGR